MMTIIWIVLISVDDKAIFENNKKTTEDQRLTIQTTLINSLNDHAVMYAYIFIIYKDRDNKSNNISDLDNEN